MAKIVEITKLDMPELTPFLRLTEAQLRNKRHPDQALFIAESPKVISCALNAGYEPVSLLMEREKIQGSARDILDRCGDVPAYTGDAALLESLTGFRLSRGVLCAMRRKPEREPEAICKDARRIAVLERIVDPTNVGAIFRSAAALGMDAVLLDPCCCDPLHRRALRVSMGTVFQIPWGRLGNDSGAWPKEGFSRVKSMGFSTAALALDARAISITSTQLQKKERLALFLGTEGKGLLPETIAMCDNVVMIPMSNGVDSLNVAAASAVAFWELR